MDSSNNINPGQKLIEAIQNPERRRVMSVRRKAFQRIRQFFDGRDFEEVQTPLLVRSPGMEPHINPFKTTTGEYLPTSPEFAMKKLLVAGMKRIYQIAPTFRNELASPHHHHEFNMLEWYRAKEDEQVVMQDTENLVSFLALNITSSTTLRFGSNLIETKAPWPRYKINDLFKQFVDIDLTRSTSLADLQKEASQRHIYYSESDSWDEIYHRIWLEKIEPMLPNDRCYFVTHYPASQAALSVIDTSEGFPWARRFEAYAGPMELGNAYYELTNPEEQLKRFEFDQKERQRIYGDSYEHSPIDEDFIAALKFGLPECAGIAIGVDRLVMLLANTQDIDMTHWLPSYRHKVNRT